MGKVKVIKSPRKRRQSLEQKTESDDDFIDDSELTDVYVEPGSGSSSRRSTSAIPQSDRYIVERIIEHRGTGKKIEYRLRWQGYGSADDTWEPGKVVSEDCPEVLHRYWKDIKRTGKTASKSPSQPKVSSSTIRRTDSSEHKPTFPVIDIEDFDQPLGDVNSQIDVAQPQKTKAKSKLASFLSEDEDEDENNGIEFLSAGFRSPNRSSSPKNVPPADSGAKPSSSPSYGSSTMSFAERLHAHAAAGAGRLLFAAPSAGSSSRPSPSSGKSFKPKANGNAKGASTSTGPDNGIRSYFPPKPKKIDPVQLSDSDDDTLKPSPQKRRRTELSAETDKPGPSSATGSSPATISDKNVVRRLNFVDPGSPEIPVKLPQQPPLKQPPPKSTPSPVPMPNNLDSGSDDDVIFEAVGGGSAKLSKISTGSLPEAQPEPARLVKGNPQRSGQDERNRRGVSCEVTDCVEPTESHVRDFPLIDTSDNPPGHPNSKIVENYHVNGHADGSFLVKFQGEDGYRLLKREDFRGKYLIAFLDFAERTLLTPPPTFKKLPAGNDVA